MCVAFTDRNQMSVNVSWSSATASRIIIMRWRYAFMRCSYKCLIIKGAEGVRFELTRPFGLPVFKTGAINRSATPPKECD